MPQPLLTLTSPTLTLAALVIFFSKSLLRHPSARSNIEEFTGDSHFQWIIPDPAHEAGDLKPHDEIERVILCSGQVYAALHKYRAENKIDNVAITRIEQLHPFPWEQLRENLDQYPNAKTIVWAQEEPLNAGAWTLHAAAHRDAAQPDQVPRPQARHVRRPQPERVGRHGPQVVARQGGAGAAGGLLSARPPPGGRVRHLIRGADHSGRGDPPFPARSTSRSCLQFVAKGVNIGYSPDEGEYTTRLDGGGDRDTLVTRDGVPLYDRGPALEDIWGSTTIDPHMIENIEVFRGGNSLFYGSNGGIGVISLVSKKPERRAQEPSLGAAYGSFKSPRAVGQLHPPARLGRQAQPDGLRLLPGDRRPAHLQPGRLCRQRPRRRRLAALSAEPQRDRREIPLADRRRTPSSGSAANTPRSWFQDPFPDGEVHFAQHGPLPDLRRSRSSGAESDSLLTEVNGYYSNPKLWNTELYPDICKCQDRLRQQPGHQRQGQLRRLDRPDLRQRPLSRLRSADPGQVRVQGDGPDHPQHRSTWATTSSSSSAASTSATRTIRSGLPDQQQGRGGDGSVRRRPSETALQPQHRHLGGRAPRLPCPTAPRARPSGSSAQATDRRRPLRPRQRRHLLQPAAEHRAVRRDRHLDRQPPAEAREHQDLQRRLRLQHDFDGFAVSVELGAFETKITDRIQGSSDFRVPATGIYGPRNTFFNNTALTQINGVTADLNLNVGRAWRLNLGYTAQNAA